MSHLVLLVEDDDKIAAPLVRALEREGYAVERVARGRAAIDRLPAPDVDLVLLDLGLPDVDGLEVCRRVRADGYDGGIIILTARGGEIDRVVGLDVGADDYLAKPFGLAELLARARALLRRSAGPGATAGAGPVESDTDRSRADRVLRGAGAAGGVADRADGHPASGTHPDLRVAVAARRAWVSGEELPLTAKEFDVLALLDEEREAVVPRERLMAEVWDQNWYGSTKTLDATVGRLRLKLEDRRAPVRIVTVRGIGFRLESGSGDA